MARGKGKGVSRKRAKRKLVIIFGENENDTKAIASFLRGLISDANLLIEARKRPPVLIKDADPEDYPSRTRQIRAIIEAARVDHDVIAIFAHEDCDQVEDAHLALEAKIKVALADGRHAVEAAVPAWEIEAWLMQWPDAFPLHVPSWRSIAQYKGRRVGLIVDAKEELARSLKPVNGGREYRESDSSIIADIVRARGWVRDPQARSDSFQKFVEAADRVAAAAG